jgi:hypothetical protein
VTYGRDYHWRGARDGHNHRRWDDTCRQGQATEMRSVMSRRDRNRGAGTTPNIEGLTATLAVEHDRLLAEQILFTSQAATLTQHCVSGPSTDLVQVMLHRSQ